MSQELIAIVGFGIALLGQSLFAMRSINLRIDHLADRIDSLSGRSDRMEDDVKDLGQSIAHTDGLLEGLREAVAGRSTA